MAKNDRRAQTEREIQRLWDARPVEERTPKHVEEFAEDARRNGMRLHENSTLNIQHVRGLLRAF